MFKFLILWCRRLAGILLLAGISTGSPLSAKPPDGTCYAVSKSGSVPAPSAMECSEAPAGYQSGVLWLRLPISEEDSEHRGSLVVHTTRFDRLSTIFEYPDGFGEPQTVSRGAYRDHWHIGGQIAFATGAGATAAWMRFESLEDYNLLRVRFVAGGAVARQFELSALAIGAALALLGIAALYNFSLAGALRRTFFLWHGCWAASLFLWGMAWSQAALLIVPTAAGTVASRVATILACLAIMFAAFSAASALRSALSEIVRRSIIGLGFLVFPLHGFGITRPFADTARSGPHPQLLHGAAGLCVMAQTNDIEKNIALLDDARALMGITHEFDGPGIRSYTAGGRLSWLRSNGRP